MKNFYFFCNSPVLTNFIGNVFRNLQVFKHLIYAGIILCVVIFAGKLTAQTITQPTGTGTSSNPYIIASLDNLNWIADQVDNQSNNFAGMYFLQTADIDASSTYNWNSGQGFSPIGNDSTSFQGYYKGNDHTIDSLFISRDTTNYIGLFGNAYKAVIEGLGMIDVKITGNEWVGGLVGLVSNNSTIRNCYSTGTVSGTNKVGGLVGKNYAHSTINKSYSFVKVKGGDYAGGLVGVNNASNIGNSYSVGKVSGSSYIGGLVGNTLNGAAVTGSFWNEETSGIDTSAGGTGINTVWMKSPTTFADSGWSSNNWYMDPGFNSGYPYLSWQNTGGTPLLQSVAPSGSGTQTSPYIISNLNNLFWITKNSSSWAAYFYQTSDIEASYTSTWYGGSGFSSIGNLSIPFSGQYNGSGHTIDSLFISDTTVDEISLFGNTSGAEIDSLGMINVNITGHFMVGGLVGYAQDWSNVSSCYSTGSVSGFWNVGGLVGDVGGSTVSNSYSTGIVSGSANAYSVGGLAGMIMGSSTVSNSYSTSSVSASYDVGGLVGEVVQSTVSNSYCIGNVSGGIETGGLVGLINKSTVTNSFWNTETSGIDTSAGGTGKTTAEMKSYSTYFNAGWDFMDETTNGTNDYWGINETGTQNSGYPFLKWQGYSNLTKPIVTTQSVTNITETTATGNGTVTALGSPNPSQYGVCWDTTGSPTISGNKTEEGALSSTGSYTSNITGLIRVTTYYLRAYATNSVGTSYGELVSFTTNFSDNGSGTSSDPYLISTLADLKCLSEKSFFWAKTFYYKQTADIDASSTYSWNSGKGFSPIGNDSIKFSAHYNGNGHTIDSLFISRNGIYYIGLFGYVSRAVIDSLGVINENVIGNGFDIGGLVGESYSNSKISYCYSTGSVSGGGVIVGGLVGQNYSSTVSNCYSNGSVDGSSYVGGLVGQNYSSTVSNCYCDGTVNGSSYVGGLAGSSSMATVTGSFWDVTTSGLGIDDSTSGSDGGTGENTTHMKTDSTFLNAGWSTSTWYMDSGINNGYPYLSWQNLGGSPLPVELTTFTASIEQGKVVLNWKTATQVNNYGFDVERKMTNDLMTNDQNSHSSSPSLNGHSLSSDWEKIGFVKGAGNSNSPKSYSFVDKNPLAGTVEYRLKQLDNDGSIKYSKIVGASFMKPTAFTLYQNYPNPFNPSTNLKYNLPYNSHVMLTIYNTLGQRVKVLIDKTQSAGYYNYQWNANEMASGVYICVLNANSTNGKQNYQSIKKMVLLK